MMKSGTVLLQEQDRCALRRAIHFFENSGFYLEIPPDEECRNLMIKMKDDTPITLPLHDRVKNFFSTLITFELNRLSDDPAIECHHTAEEHLYALCYVLDNLMPELN